jgi:hypothetical protein
MAAETGTPGVDAPLQAGTPPSDGKKKGKRMRMERICRWLTAAVFLWFLVPATPAAAEPETIPFVPGETLTFELRWGFIPAGTAVLRIMPIETVDGEPVYHFVMEARTNSLVDAFYKYRSRIDAYASLDMSRSIRYQKITTVYSTRKAITVTFDWSRMKARYLRETTEPGQEPEIDRDRRTDLLPGTFDPLSAFYFSRMHTFCENGSFERPVTDGKKCVIAKANVIKKERLTVDGKSFPTFLIEPELKHIEGVFEKSDDARVQIWVSADAHQIPVRLESEVIIGSFTGELKKAHGLRRDSPATAFLSE